MVRLKEVSGWHTARPRRAPSVPAGAAARGFQHGGTNQGSLLSLQGLPCAGQAGACWF